MAGRFEPLHPILALTRRPMRVLTPIIEITTLAMFHPGEDLALGRAIALQLISDDDARHVGKQNPQSARRNDFLGEQLSRWFLLLSKNLSASNYPGAAYGHLVKRIGEKTIYQRRLTGFLNDIGMSQVAQFIQQ